MKHASIPGLAALLVLLLIPLVGCDKATSPDAENALLLSPVARSAASYGPDSLDLWSGAGACGDRDAGVLVSSPCEPVAQPALIGGGGADSLCACGLVGDPLSTALPVTTLCETDSLGTFEARFALPALFSDVVVTLSVVADDGAAVSVNGHAIGTVDLNDGDPAAPAVVRQIAISGDSLFVPGENVLRFDLVNTGTGAYGAAAPRADSADCMYLEFAARVDYVRLPVVTIDVRPTINCDKDTGVIPVVIFTTDEFDAANVDHTTVRFGPNGASEAHVNPHGVIRHVEDVDDDGDMDLVFHFRRGETGIQCGDTTARLWGTTIDGYDFEAYDTIRTVGGK